MTHTIHHSDSADTAYQMHPLPASLTIETVQAFADELRSLPLPAGSSLALDASSLERVTTPGVQLLLALEKMLNAAGKTLVLSNPQRNMEETFRALGMESTFAAWNANPLDHTTQQEASHG